MNQSFGATRRSAPAGSHFPGSSAPPPVGTLGQYSIFKSFSDPFLDVVAKGYRADVLVVSARIAIS